MEITMKDELIQHCLHDMAEAVDGGNRFRYERASRRLDDVLASDDPDLALTVEEWHDKRVAEDMGIPAEEWTAASALAAR